MQINARNKTAHHILRNDIDLMLPKFLKGRKSKRVLFSVILSGFVGLAFKGNFKLFCIIEDIKPCIKQ